MHNTSAHRHRSLGTRVYDALFRVFGPAQLGDPGEGPPPYVDPASARCPRCGRSMVDHGYVETPERRRLRCPE